MKPPPINWTKDKLSKHLQDSYQNQWATFANKKNQYSKLKEIDDCFCLFAEKGLLNLTIIVPTLLFVRSHSAYLASANLTLSGQIPEGHVLMRSCIEYAGYALHIFKNEGYEEIWLRRHDNKKSHTNVREKFKNSKIIGTIKKEDKKLSELYEQFYNDSIDFGAHPNERALTSNLKMKEDEDGKSFLQAYLQGDGKNLDFALKRLAQVGLCSLHIFQHIYKERFSILGLKQKIYKLREGL